MTSRRLNRRQARWSLELAEFNFKLSWAPGSKNPADGPSRRPDYVPQEGDIIKNINFQSLLKSHHTDWILNNPNLNTPNPPPPSYPPTIVAAISHTIDTAASIDEFKQALASDSTWREALSQEAGNRHKNWSQLNDFMLFCDRIYVPPSLRSKILFNHHDSALAGHPGRAKTIELIGRDYAWPSMSSDIRRYVRSCDLCQRNKVSRHAPYGELIPLEIPTRNWESISMDFITDLPLSHGSDTLLVVVDRLSKQAHFIPTVKALDAPGLARLYITTVFKLHGLPASIVSDRGSVFTSLFWEALTSQLGVQLKLSTAYHPQTDGQTERVNQCIEQYLRNYCSYQQDDWVDWLGLAEFQYNNLIHDSTRTTPFFANYGFHPTFSITPMQRATTPAASDFLEHLNTIRSELRAELKLAQETAKGQYNTHRAIAPTLNPGDLVMLS